MRIWDRKRWRAPIVTGLLTLIAAPVVAASPPTVALSDGKISGIARDGIVEYRAIPYAAPPVADNRWRAPQRPARWRGVRDGTRFSPGCPSIDTLGVFGAPSEVEDCLYLNVAVPADARGRKLPVLFWIPGGGFFTGSAADYDPSALTRRGMVVVTLNYRLGLLGFLSHAALDQESGNIANYGLLDQQAALRWVRTNIARFGGDPANITVAGESAGGSSALHHMISPGARGLFHKVINQSGLRMVISPIATARTAGDRFATAAGCAPADTACLRSLPVSAILANERAHFSGVIVGDTVLPSQPGAAILAGETARVPVLTGFTAHEQSFLLAIREATQGPLDAAANARDLTFLSRDRIDDVLAAYPPEAYPTISEANIAATQGARACTGRWAASASARWTPTWAFVFDDTSAPPYFSRTSFAPGAFHTADLLYLFPGFKGGMGVAQPLTPTQQAVADEMLDYWANFARTGDPNGAGLRPWPRYDPATDSFNAIGSGRVIEGFGAQQRCALWDEINRY